MKFISFPLKMSVIPTNAPWKEQRPPTYFSSDWNGSREYRTGVLVIARSDKRTTKVIESGFPNNGLLGAIHAAFSKHLPLKIDPDDIWIAFMAQVSIIINKDPERYRHSFVSHSDKKIIAVRDDTLILGQDVYVASDKWRSIFPLFEDEIDKKTKVKIGTRFTTTTDDKYITAQIMIMSSMKEYFDYRVMTLCGIPEIRIGGTIFDWITLQNKIKDISERIEKKDWVPKFNKFIDESILVLKNEANRDFWAKLYHYEGPVASGKGPTTSGIINDLFPIDQDGKDAVGSNEHRSTGTFPNLVGVVDFKWIYYLLEYNCEFISGLTDVAIDDNDVVSPKATWRIVKK